MKHIFIAGAVAALSSPAFADRSLDGYYLGIHAGLNEVESKPFAIDDQTRTAGLRFGYHLNPFVSFEVGYTHLGEAEGAQIDEFGDTLSTSITTQYASLGTKINALIIDDFSFGITAGLASWDVSAEQSDSAFVGQRNKSDDQGVDLYFGAHAEYWIERDVRIGVELTVLDIEANLSGIDGVNNNNSITASIAYDF